MKEPERATSEIIKERKLIGRESYRSVPVTYFKLINDLRKPKRRARGQRLFLALSRNGKGTLTRNLKSHIKRVLTRMGERDDFLRPGVEIVLLVGHDGPGLEGGGFVPLHGWGDGAAAEAVHVQQLVDLGDLGNLGEGPARHVGRVLHAQLAEDLLLDGGQAEVAQPFAKHARRALRSGGVRVIFRLRERRAHQQNQGRQHRCHLYPIINPSLQQTQ